MGGMFGGKPKALPAPIAPPPVPTIDDASSNRDAADRSRRRRGKAASIYAGDSGKSDAGGKTQTGG